MPVIDQAVCHSFYHMLKRYFFTGLLVLVPFFITAWVLVSLLNFMDQSMLLLPKAWQPEALLGFRVIGLGTILTLVIVLLTGMVATNFLGKRILSLWEGVLARLPVVKSIYSGVKQVSDTLFAGTSHAFTKTLLVRYPHQDSWALAFLTGYPGREILTHLSGEYVSVYVPTTPNPTSGFFLIVPKAQVIELDISVNEALKYIISMGAVGPETVS